MEKEILKLINKLMEVPAGEQLYRNEIRMLFDLLKMRMTPRIGYIGNEVVEKKRITK